jgi:hypothetical protein
MRKAANWASPRILSIVRPIHRLPELIDNALDARLARLDYGILEKQHFLK